MAFDFPDVPDDWKRGVGGCPRMVRLDRLVGHYGYLTRASVMRARETMQSADVVHLHMPWDPVNLRLGREARRVGVPYVVGIHGTMDDWTMRRSRFKKQLYLALGGRKLLESAAAVHCTAQAERDQASRWFPRGQAEVVPLVIDLSEYEQLPGAAPARTAFADALTHNGQPTLLYLSRLHPKKGIEHLFGAAARLREQGRPVRVLVAGTGEPEYVQSLHRLAAELHLTELVHFLGFVSGTEKVSLYQSADLFVLPTSQENWGFVLIEALACSTPVVTTRGVDIWQELEGTGGTVIVEPDPTAIASAADRLLADPERRVEMGRRGRAWVFEELAVSRVLARYEAFYGKLARSSARSSARTSESARE